MVRRRKVTREGDKGTFHLSLFGQICHNSTKSKNVKKGDKRNVPLTPCHRKKWFMDIIIAIPIIMVDSTLLVL